MTTGDCNLVRCPMGCPFDDGVPSVNSTQSPEASQDPRPSVSPDVAMLAQLASYWMPSKPLHISLPAAAAYVPIGNCAVSTCLY